VRSPRLAEMVADTLRSEILGGAVLDGDRLPTQEEIMRKVDVGLPSVREALRILEVEGLVTVHRGNVGGATVHLPDASNVAYMLAMVLESKQVGFNDVADTVHRLEPMCAGMCAGRADRATAIVPRLRELLKLQAEAVDDPPRFNILARTFHTDVVQHCGNASMALTVGSLVELWTAHEQSWTQEATSEGRFPDVTLQEAIIDVHEKITDAIELGDAELATRLSASHLHAAQTYHLSVEQRPHVVCEPLRYSSDRR